MNAKGRWVCSLSVLLGKIKGGGNILKLNDKRWCKSYCAGTQYSSGLEMKRRFVAIKAGRFASKRSDGSRSNTYPRALFRCAG